MKNIVKKLSVVLASLALIFGTLALPEIASATSLAVNYSSLTFGCVSGPQNGFVVPPTSSVFANCSATVYLHGTSTLAGLYTSATAGTAAANPLAAGSGNQTVTFFVADGQYDVCVNNSASTPVLQSSCNYGIVVNSGPLFTNGQKAALTSAFTSANASGLQAITGLAITFPSTFASSVAFHCALGYSEATPAAGASFGLAVLTTAPTRLDAVDTAFTSAAGASVVGPITNLASTTPTAFGTFTPGSTVIYPAYIDGVVQLAGGGAATLQVYVQQGTAADVIAVAPGSYCQVL